MSVEKKYQRFAVALVALFVLASVVIALCAKGGRMCVGSAEETPVFIGAGRLESLEFTEESCYVSVGGQLQLQLRTQPEMYDDVVTWTSSDATVLKVDADGVVTARKNGTAVVTAEFANGSDSITVSVVDDILVSAADCIRALSVGCDGEKLADAEQMKEKLDRCAVENADKLSDAISNIIAYTDGGDRDALEAAVSASGLDRNLCRTAAASCWAYGEQRACGGVISFVGDCTLASYNEDSGRGRFPSLYSASGSVTYPFDRVRGIFAGDDLTVINFEGTLTTAAKHRDKTFYFRGLPEYAQMLPASSIEAASLANNHSSDYYQTGYDDTVSHLTGAGVLLAGEDMPLTTQTGSKNTPVVLLAANAVGKDYSKNVREGLLAAVKEHKDGRTVVIVSLHWGVEGTQRPEEWQRTAAHELIDAGADLIVGHHPHVMHGIEMYNGKYIAYSLGNFAFGGNMTVNDPHALILRARLGIDESGRNSVTGISVVPCRTTSTGTKVNNYQPILCFGRDGDSVYSALISRSKAIGGVEALDRPDL